MLDVCDGSFGAVDDQRRSLALSDRRCCAHARDDGASGRCALNWRAGGGGAPCV